MMRFPRTSTSWDVFFVCRLFSLSSSRCVCVLFIEHSRGEAAVSPSYVHRMHVYY